MKEEQQQLSDAEISHNYLAEMKPHSLYKQVEGLPIPAQNGLVVWPIPESNIVKSLLTLEGGQQQEIYGVKGENTQSTCEGIIMRVGATCTKFPKVGFKIQYSSMI